MPAPQQMPLIGLSGRRGRAEVIGAPRGFHDSPLDIYMSEYSTSVISAGGLPVNLPIDAEPAALVQHLDAVVLTGGEDVDPRRYGEAPGPHTGWIDPQRDAFEVGLIHAAMAKGIPVFGICRGHQLINVALGGSLIQHLEIGEGESHASYAYPRAHRVHPVELDAGSIAGGVLGASVLVNTYHHQAVGRLADGLSVIGRAPDGVVEAVQHESAPVLGVQWHPEVFGDDPLFGWLVETAARLSSARNGAHPRESDPDTDTPDTNAPDTTTAEKAAA